MSPPSARVRTATGDTSSQRLAIRIAAPLFVVALVGALYGPVLDRSFVSEDFLLLRYLHENPPWEDLGTLFTQPWLGISLVGFWRPLAVLFFGIESALFGVDPVPYNLLHVVLHAGNGLIVFGIARYLMPGQARWEATSVAVLFSVYPLHPNAVVFLASHATLIAASCTLGALLAYLRFRASRNVWVLSLSVLLFALSLASYEAAVVLPVLLVGIELLGLGEGTEERLRRRLLPVTPFVALAGLYLAARKLVVGTVLGGYAETSSRLLAPAVTEIVHDLWFSVYRLHLPDYGHGANSWVTAAVAVAVVVVPLAIFLRRPRSRRTRVWLFAWVIILASIAPFGGEPVVPGNGRYWYIAALGVSLALTTFVAGLAGQLRRPYRSIVPLAVLGILAIAWCSLLTDYLRAHTEAAETATLIRERLAAVEAEPDEPLFVAGVPRFVRTETGAPLAQIYHWGLSDAVRPPFSESRRTIYPLPPRFTAANDVLPLLAAGHRVLRWRNAEQRFIEIDGPSAAPPHRTLEVNEPSGGDARIVVRDESLRLRFVLLSEGTHDLVPFAADADDDAASARPRHELVAAMRHLYDSPIYWWVEGRNAEGSVRATSRLRRWGVSPGVTSR